MTQYQWLKACEEFHEILWTLKTNSKEETRLYKLTRKFEIKGNFYYENPVYMIWWQGKNILATEYSNLAYSKWEKLNEK